jgi:predicted lipoprotein with Yx(FWY)xxD motif
MRTIITRRLLAAAALLAIAGCGGATAAGTSSAGGGNASTPTPTSSATVTSATVTGHGAVLVAGSNGMTLYQFDKDTAGSGMSACTGGCISTWPPLTVPAGTTPTAASTITGMWGTIVRTDGMGTQVTFNGLPLYFYSKDSKPGDANGDYPHWASISAASGGAASGPTAAPPGSAPTPPATSNPYGY